MKGKRDPSAGRRANVLAALVLAIPRSASACGRRDGFRRQRGSGQYSGHRRIRQEGPQPAGLGTAEHRLPGRPASPLRLRRREDLRAPPRRPGGVLSGRRCLPGQRGINSSCGDRDIDVDDTAGSTQGNISRRSPPRTSIYGWLPGGSALSSIASAARRVGSPSPTTGTVWGGNYGGPSVKKYSSAAGKSGSLSISTSFCKLEIDPSNNDLYVAPYSTAPIYRYTAARGYTASTIPLRRDNNPGIRVRSTPPPTGSTFGQWHQRTRLRHDVRCPVETLRTGSQPRGRGR